MQSRVESLYIDSMLFSYLKKKDFTEVELKKQFTDLINKLTEELEEPAKKLKQAQELITQADKDIKLKKSVAFAKNLKVMHEGVIPLEQAAELKQVEEPALREAIAFVEKPFPEKDKYNFEQGVLHFCFAWLYEKYFEFAKEDFIKREEASFVKEEKTIKKEEEKAIAKERIIPKGEEKTIAAIFKHYLYAYDFIQDAKSHTSPFKAEITLASLCSLRKIYLEWSKTVPRKENDTQKPLPTGLSSEENSRFKKVLDSVLPAEPKPKPATSLIEPLGVVGGVVGSLLTPFGLFAGAMVGAAAGKVGDYLVEGLSKCNRR